MWLIESLKSELPSNAILVSNFLELHFIKRKLHEVLPLGSERETQRQREDAHLTCTLKNNLEVTYREL